MSMQMGAGLRYISIIQRDVNAFLVSYPNRVIYCVHADCLIV